MTKAVAEKPQAEPPAPPRQIRDLKARWVRRFRLSLNIAAVVALTSVIHAQAYRFGRVWDGEKVLTNAVIVVEKDRIKSIGASTGDAIDMTRYTAIPGMIDVHTHLTYVLDANRIGQAGRGAAAVYLSQDNAKKTLETGVTTVRESGCERLRRYRDAGPD